MYDQMSEDELELYFDSDQGLQEIIKENCLVKSKELLASVADSYTFDQAELIEWIWSVRNDASFHNNVLKYFFPDAADILGHPSLDITNENEMAVVVFSLKGFFEMKEAGGNKPYRKKN